jgi:hypothetical protein
VFHRRCHACCMPAFNHKHHFCAGDESNRCCNQPSSTGTCNSLRLLHRSSATRHGQHQQSCTSRLHHMHQTDRCQLSHTTHECMLPYSQAEPGLSALCTPSTHRRAGLYACMHAAAIMPVSGVSECLSRWVRMPLTMDPLLLPPASLAAIHAQPAGGNHAPAATLRAHIRPAQIAVYPPPQCFRSYHMALLYPGASCWHHSAPTSTPPQHHDLRQPAP